MLRSVCAVALVAAAVHIGSDRLIRTGESAAKLGLPGYAYPAVHAPAAKGWTLALLSRILTQSPLGPAIRRHLLDSNGIAELRELAAGIPDYQPLVTPLLRLSPKAKQEAERQSAAAAASGLDAESILEKGFPADIKSGSKIEAYHTLYRSGRVTPIDVLTRVIAATKRLQPTYVAFAEVNEDQVMAEAAASARRWASPSGPLSMLDGVPIAVKDMIDTNGHLTSYGSASHQGKAKAAADDVLVSKFRALGAIILGTTVMTEGGVTPLGYSVQYRGPFNPWSAEHYSGGSSSGSAVAVALGLCPIAIGFDGGGSIRIPASFSGVVGLATSFARVDYATSSAITNVKAGPLAATTADAAIAFAAMTRPSSEPTSMYFDVMYDGNGAGGRPTAHLGGFQAADLSGVRLGMFAPHFNDTAANSDVHAVTTAAVAALVSRGAVVVPIEIPSLKWLRLAHAIKISTEFASSWDKKYSEWADLEPNTRITIGLGMSVTAVEALACDKIRAWAFEFVTRLFQEQNITAIVSPTLPMTAPKFPADAMDHGESNTGLVVEMMKYISLANFLGFPAVSVPVGADSTNDNMPIGLQFLGPHWSEHDLLRLSRATELAIESIGNPADYVDVLNGDKV